MGDDMKNRLRDEILVQVGVLRKVMEHYDVASISHSYSTEGGEADGSMSGRLDACLDKDGQPADVLEQPVTGAAFPNVYLLPNGGIHRDLKPAILSFKEAASILAENISDYIYDTAEVEILNQIRMQIRHDGLFIQLDVSKGDEPVFRDWSFAEGSFCGRYIIADDHGSLWGHLFADPQGDDREPVEMYCRFVFDKDEERLIAAEVRSSRSSQFDPLSKDEISDLEDSLVNANGILQAKPALFGLQASSTLPDWVKAEAEPHPEMEL